MKVKAILAVNNLGVIGWSTGEIPWLGEHPEDLKRFKKLTLDNIIVMGRNTWESLPFKPLLNRVNVVISSKPFVSGIAPDLQFESFENAYKILTATDIERDIWIIGGAKLLESTLDFIEEIHLTEIDNDYVGDILIPDITAKFRVKSIQISELDPLLKFVIYEKN